MSSHPHAIPHGCPPVFRDYLHTCPHEALDHRPETHGAGLPTPLVDRDRLLAALASETRLEILEQLLQGARDVSAIAVALDLDVPKISYDLKKLFEVGLVDFVQEGNRHIYSISTATESCMCNERICLAHFVIGSNRITLSLPRSSSRAQGRPLVRTGRQTGNGFVLKRHGV